MYLAILNRKLSVTVTVGSLLCSICIVSDHQCFLSQEVTRSSTNVSPVLRFFRGFRWKKVTGPFLLRLLPVASLVDLKK